jgi:hypothetical protein
MSAALQEHQPGASAVQHLQQLPVRADTAAEGLAPRVRFDLGDQGATHRRLHWLHKVSAFFVWTPPPPPPARAADPARAATARRWSSTTAGRCEKHIFLFFRESDARHQAIDRVLHTPGYYYRPKELKSMVCLMGNTEQRKIYRNFEHLNLNLNKADQTHQLYTRYLKNNQFIPPGENGYFAHIANSQLVADPGSTDTGKGAFNIFPLSLTSEELNKTTSQSIGKAIALSPPKRTYFYFLSFFSGVVTSTPLKLEIEFEPVMTITWFMFYTFVYANKIDFTGSKSKQEVMFDFLK